MSCGVSVSVSFTVPLRVTVAPSPPVPSATASAPFVPSGSSSFSRTSISAVPSSFTSSARTRSSRAIGVASGTFSSTVICTLVEARRPRASVIAYSTDVLSSRSGAVTSRYLPLTLAFSPGTSVGTVTAFSRANPNSSPSGSESFASAAIATSRPGRMTTESRTA